MRRWQGYAPLIAVALLGVLILIFAEPAARWLASKRAERNGLVVGHIVLAEGLVRRIHGSNIDLIASPVSQPADLHDGDRIQTSVDSKAVIVLNSEDELDIPSGAVLQFQLWNAADSGSPIYITSMLGEIGLRKSGVRGKAYVVKEGRLYFPGQKPVQKAMALTVLKSAPLDLQLAENQAAPGDFQGDKSPAAGEETAPSESAKTSAFEPETLSNELIDQTIVNHQALLQKCWLTRLKDEAGLKGQVIVQFGITKRGKVKDAHVIDSSLNDETLKNCVLSVFERLEFQPFKGSEISLSYPITFE